MGWRFRKSFSPLPGVRLNFSPRGISTSVGVGPLRVYLGPKGAAVTTRIPGSGMSFRQTLGQPHSTGNSEPYVPPLGSPPSPQILPTPGMGTLPTEGEIRSASTAVLTTKGLAPLKELVEKAQSERAVLLPELHQAESAAIKATERCKAWTNGWLLRRLFKNRFARIAAIAEETSARAAELAEQERLSRLATQFDLPAQLKDAFGRVCDATAFLSQSHRIWDTLSRVATDRVRERSTATTSINRELVTVGLGSSDVIESHFDVPHLSNANGGDVFIYPGFVLYHISTSAFALVDAREVTITSSAAPFIEEEGVPADSEIVSQTWKKANKDGSPDKRFANNYQIPIVRYGRLRLESKTGMQEEYMISNFASSERVAAEWAGFQKALRAATT
jgi:hypothetical protein